MVYLLYLHSMPFDRLNRSDQLKISGSTLLISHSSMLQVAREAADAVGFSTSQIILMDDAVPGFPTVSQIIARGRQLTEAQVGGEVVLTTEDIQKVPSLVPFSSGTTGLPKGVALSQYNLVANVCQWLSINPPEPVTGEDVRVCMIPLFHSTYPSLFSRL